MNTTAIAIGRSRLASHFAETHRIFKAGLRSHALVYVLSSGILAIALTVALLLDRLLDFKMVLLFSLPILLLLIIIFCGFTLRHCFRLWRSGFAGSPIREVGRLIVSDLLEPHRIANFLHAAIALSMFMSAFASLKIFLPAINPFQWDEMFMEWDRIVHFGAHPYQILHPLLGYPNVTWAVNLIYNCWFYFMFSAWVWQGAAKADNLLRQRFLVAFVITWFIGTNVLGTIFSSAGPCFYGRVLDGDDPFLPLMAYLRQTADSTGLWAPWAQDALWNGYATGEGVIKGISAMPSMHVGTCILLVLTAFAAGKRWLGWCCVAFTLAIFLGSIHLAWHYAIDGYAGAAVALFGWLAASRLVRWDREKQGIVDA